MKEVTTREKKIKGRKRHIATDTSGNLLYVKVHSADLPDTNMGRNIAYHTFRVYSSVKGFMADLGYRGTAKEFVENELRLKMNISDKSSNPGFNLHVKRWPVERTFGWFGIFRRLAKDYEFLSRVSENWIRLAMISVLLTRLF